MINLRFKSRVPFSEQVQPEQTQLEQIQLEQTQLEQVQPEQTQLEQIQLEQTQLEQVQPEQTQLEQIQLEQTQLEQTLQTPVGADSALNMPTTVCVKPSFFFDDSKQTSASTPDSVRVALFHKTNYAFLFSGTTLVSRQNLSSLSPNIKTVRVHCALQPRKNKLIKKNLLAVSTTHKEPPEKKQKLVQLYHKPKPLACPPDTTLAPTFDSRLSTLTSFDLTELVAISSDFNYSSQNHNSAFNHLEKDALDLNSKNINNSNPQNDSCSNFSSVQHTDFDNSLDSLQILLEFGFDQSLVESISKLPDILSPCLSPEPDNISILLKQNSLLLYELQVLHDQRLLSNTFDTVSETELELAQVLEDNLLALSKINRPKKLFSSSKVISDSIQRIYPDYPMYGGTLPPQRAFAFSSNSTLSLRNHNFSDIKLQVLYKQYSDKFENEELIKHGWEEDVWFHVDNLSSAHVYLRLDSLAGQTWDNIPEALLQDIAQLTKANSIQGNKQDNVTIIYTPWSNLRKNQSMDTGQVSFKSEKLVRKVFVATRVNAVVNRLVKTKIEQYPDFFKQKLARGKVFNRKIVEKRNADKVSKKALAKQALIDQNNKNYDHILNTSAMKSNKGNTKANISDVFGADDSDDYPCNNNDDFADFI
ncbi:hypothetical protein BB561_002128 [Smittium simulii]|uniref:NFACT RNA-binding domain-containing protein n=1 Tax=Smittium simulii TaxID=133385 RepID=A0A2T9YRN0_9FUNG|nr:hypothetical protein BB561_002128 [Smittium simulii]